MPGDAAISYTVKRTLALTGLGKTKLYEIIRSGELPVVTVDHRTLILDEDLRVYLARHRVLRGNGSGGDDDRSHALETKLHKLIDELGPGTRARNALRADGVTHVSELLQRSEDDLLVVPNIGRVTIAQIKTALAKLGLRLQGTPC